MADPTGRATVIDPVLFWREIDHLARRVETVDARVTTIDEVGTRGTVALSVQMGSLSKDIGRLESELKALRESTTTSARYWLTTTLAILGLMAVVVFQLLK